MRDTQESQQYITKPSLVPRGLFSRIINRLGLEKELAVIKKYLGWSIVALIAFFVLFSFALLGFRAILDETSFGPFISLMFSDPSVAFRYWHSFALSFFELMPGLNLALILATIGFLMLFVRLVVIYSEKFSLVIKSINKSRYTNHERN